MKRLFILFLVIIYLLPTQIFSNWGPIVSLSAWSDSVKLWDSITVILSVLQKEDWNISNINLKSTDFDIVSENTTEWLEIYNWLQKRTFLLTIVMTPKKIWNFVLWPAKLKIAWKAFETNKLNISVFAKDESSDINENLVWNNEDSRQWWTYNETFLNTISDWINTNMILVLWFILFILSWISYFLIGYKWKRKTNILESVDDLLVYDLNDKNFESEIRKKLSILIKSKYNTWLWDKASTLDEKANQSLNNILKLLDYSEYSKDKSKRSEILLLLKDFYLNFLKD